MHSEQVVVTRKNIEQLLTGKTIGAVGTTSLRTLESIYWYGVKLMEDSTAEFVIDQNDAHQLKASSKFDSLNAILKKMDEKKTNQLLGETSIYILPG